MSFVASVSLPAPVMILSTIAGTLRRLVPSAILFAGTLPLHAEEQIAGHERVQEIALNSGWNAVYLEVEPLDNAPAKVFAGIPVDKVATLFGSPVTNQFVSDPSVDLFNGRGWGVWYSPSLPEAFLKSLDAINGSRSYLVHATQACTWRAEGRVQMAPVRWQPDAFNFVGFPVRAQAGPTFAQFFAGSKAHRNQSIYRLVNSRWKQVSNPAGEAMRSGEAFWIFSKGASDFQGPLKVETKNRAGLELARSGGEIILRNEGIHPLGATVEHVPGGGAPVPLSVLVRVYGNPSAPVAPVPVKKPSGPWTQELPPLEAGAALAMPMECRSGEMVKPQQGSLLKITTDIGTETWLPVSAYRGAPGD